MTDTDGGGTISRNELFGVLRKFRVPMTKKEFAEIFREL
jgi:Ca2+-binding EF-hand superfamily protein